MKIRLTAIPVLASSMLLLAAGTANAHLTMTGTETVVDSYGMITFSVPHGCEGKPTERINIKIPDGIVSFTPARSAFWDSEVKMRKLDKPITGPHGEEITEVPDELIYTTTGTPLPDDRMDQLVVSTRWPSKEGALYFKAVQHCPGGDKASWIQVPKEGEDPHALEHPAPGVVIAAAGAEGHGEQDSADDSSDAAADTVSAKDDDSTDDDVKSARRLGIAGLSTGVLGMLIGLAGFRRRK